MADASQNPSSQPSERQARTSTSGTFRHGRRIDRTVIERAEGLTGGASKGATWRGWLIGLLCVVVMSATIPYLDFVLKGTKFSNVMFSSSSIFFLFILIALVTAGVARLRTQLGLTRQDLVLVFCMTMVVNAIPGCGFWAFWVTAVSGGKYFGAADHRLNETAHNILPREWSPHDVEGYRPLEWFYTGMPPGKDSLWDIPWKAWVGPYVIWCVALIFLLGILFALSGLLRRQWSDREQLSFPLAQLPEEMVQGLDGDKRKPFLCDRIVWWGIGLPFALHSYNSMTDYFINLPPIPRGSHMDAYLTEPPFSALRPFLCNIYPSVIGLTYLLSLEVSFSLWFYMLIQKGINLAGAATGIGPLYPPHVYGPYVDQGTGALYALALAVFFAARSELWTSFKAAWKAGDTGEDHLEDYSPRTLWLVLVISAIGSVGWLTYFGVEVGWSMALVLMTVVAMTGLTRLSCEGGLFFMQMNNFPLRTITDVTTPYSMGTATWMKVSVWDRVMVADWFRVMFMPHIMNSLHLASRTGLRRRTVMSGMGAAIGLALVVSFFSFLGTCYMRPGGARAMDWYFERFPSKQTEIRNSVVQKMRAYEAKVDKSAETGVAIPLAEVPDVAKRDPDKLFWMGFGAVFMIGSLVARNFIFWFPHPIGYAMWMGPYPLAHLWFSFLLGWMIKAALLKYGGHRIYLHGKRFFIGVVVGEAMATVIWKIVAFQHTNIDGYNMLPN